jgi:hypothetical protein
MKSAKTLQERILEAEVKGSQWLAKGNEYSEAGKSEQAQRCYDKSQFWLDRYNRLTEQNGIWKYGA